MMNNWWLTFYDETTSTVLFNRSQQEKDKIVRFLMAVIGGDEGRLVLDQCCGTGEISHALSSHGCQVIGIDSCHSYIEQARNEIDTNCDFVIGDAAYYVTEKKCDLVINWYTSFGYSADDSYNKSMLQSAYQSLRENAYFILDFPNMVKILLKFKPTMKSTHDDFSLTRHSQIDFENGILSQIWTYERNDIVFNRRNSILKMYTPWQIVDLLKEQGFKNIEIYGTLEQKSLTLESERCYFVCQK